MTVQPQVLVDGRVISHPTAGGRGVGRYTIGLVRAMHESGVVVTVMNASKADEQKCAQHRLTHGLCVRK
jgi:hypothetical protein